MSANDDFQSVVNLATKRKKKFLPQLLKLSNENWEYVPNTDNKYIIFKHQFMRFREI